MTVRAFLFDYGGTLDGEGWHWFDRFVHLYREAGSDLPEATIKTAFYLADEKIAAEAAAHAYRLRPLIERHVELQMEALGNSARMLAGELVEGFCAITEEGWSRARAALSRLRTSGRLAVVSNFYGNLDVLLAEAGLAPLLDTVVESVRVGVEKPDPRIFALALDRLGLTGSEAVMIGDNFDRDLRPAKSLGMRTVWLRRGEGPPPQDGVADLVVSELGQIPDAFGGAPSRRRSGGNRKRLHG